MNSKFILLLFILLFFTSCQKENIPINIVMLGHSLVAGVNWNKFLGRSDIINRGRGGQDIFDMESRVQQEVIDYSPKTCFILLGYEGQSANLIDSSFLTVKKMVDQLQRSNIDVILQSSILYSEIWDKYESLNSNLSNYNQMVKNWVEIQNDNRLHFIDLNLNFAPEGFRLDYLSHDGIHLNDQGNELWIRIIADFIKQNQL